MRETRGFSVNNAGLTSHLSDSSWCWPDRKTEDFWNVPPRSGPAEEGGSVAFVACFFFFLLHLFGV